MLLLAVVPLSAADLQTGLSPTTARVGEALHFRLKVSGAAGKTIRFGRPSEAKWSVLQTDSSRLKSGELEYVIAV
ncbi:MAG: hypothetical protein HY966_01595 [Ignavibacteriales bacterium]|nr:hypothetical protein [Ignavibacteriales bacterium]